MLIRWIFDDMRGAQLGSDLVVVTEYMFRVDNCSNIEVLVAS